jgi:hypothetical protein
MPSTSMTALVTKTRFNEEWAAERPLILGQPGLEGWRADLSVGVQARNDLPFQPQGTSAQIL